MKRIYIFLLFLTGASALFSANRKTNEQGSYDGSIQLLTESYHKSPHDSLAARIAETYVLARQFEHALTWLDKISDIEKWDRGRQLITKGDALFGIGKPDRALDMYTLYSGISGDNTPILDRVNAVRNVQRAREMSGLWNIENLPFNTAGNEWFVTNFRTRELIISDHHKPVNATSEYVDFFTLEREYDKWLDPRPLMRPEDENHRRNGVSFSRDGNTVYFTEDVTETITNGSGKNAVTTERVRTALYSATILANRLYDITELKLVPPGYSIKDPCIDATGTILYFASDMPGGMGGYDIYLSRYIKGRWLLPENLGPAINSSYDELAPYVRQDSFESSLYFVSDRPFGFGGLDIYQARTDGKKYFPAEILSPPLNSPADERSIMFDLKKMSGYLTSNRAGGKGGYDVYRFQPYGIVLAVQAKNGAFANGRLDDVEALADADGNLYFPVHRGQQHRLVIESRGHFPMEQVISVANNEVRDTIRLSVALQETAPASAAAGEEEQFIDLNILVRDEQGNIVPWYLFTIINLQTSRVRKIQADETGLLEQYLLPESDYRLLATELNYGVSERISTRSIAPGSTMKYVLRISDSGYSMEPYRGN